MKPGDKRLLAVFATLTVIWMIVIYGFSAQPAEESYKASDLVLAIQQKYFDTFFHHFTPFLIRKSAHMAEFGVLALLVTAVLRSGGHSVVNHYVKLNDYAAALIFSSFYALTDELHQYFVPGRNATLLDWFFDTLGALAVLWIVYVISTRMTKIKNKNNGSPLKK